MLPAGGLVVKVARVPNTELVRGQVELDHRGAVVVDADLGTSQPGVFAAGDAHATRVARVQAQLALLEEALDGLFADVRAGRKRFVPYESLKLYGSVDVGAE